MNTYSKKWKAIIGCLIVQLCVGILYLWSIFSDEIVRSFHWNTEAAKMVSSYMMLAYVVGNLIGGFLNDKRGPKFTCIAGVTLLAGGFALTGLLDDQSINLIYLTYCVMGGMGSGFAYGACISCIQKWLPDRRGLASGLAVSAFGMSTVVFAPVSQWLMKQYAALDGTVNFRPVFFWLGGVFFAAGILACFLISLPESQGGWTKDTGALSTGRTDYTLRQAIRTVPFWCMFAAIFFGNGTWNLTVPLIKGLAMDRGLSEGLAVFCVSFTGFASAAGRLIGAAASDKLGRPLTIGILSGVTMVGAFCMTFISGYAYIAVVAVIAFAFGGPCATNAALSTDFFGTKYSGSVYGVMMLALGISSIAFNWLSAHLLHGAVTATFLMAAVSAVVPILLMWNVNRCQKNWNS